MRELDTKILTQAVKAMCIEANRFLPEDIAQCLQQCAATERNPLAQSVLQDLNYNAELAKDMRIPVCQDTGMAVVFAEIGQEVHLVNGDFEAAVHEGVRQGYVEGRLRCSVVGDPLRRVNTEDNTPAILHTRMVPGDRVTLTVAPKGFGSENMSAIRMLTPAANQDDILDFVVETVRKAGSNPCPPMVVGVGIGGDFEWAAILAKKALCRDIRQRHPDLLYRDLEEAMLQAVNQTHIGPQGFGGDTTALAVNIETYPTHIAGLPVAVNIGCHVTRHCTRII